MGDTSSHAACQCEVCQDVLVRLRMHSTRGCGNQKSNTKGVKSGS